MKKNNENKKSKKELIKFISKRNEELTSETSEKSEQLNNDEVDVVEDVFGETYYCLSVIEEIIVSLCEENIELEKKVNELQEAIKNLTKN